jgi:hypothetical protein
MENQALGISGRIAVQCRVPVERKHISALSMFICGAGKKYETWRMRSA